MSMEKAKGFLRNDIERLKTLLEEKNTNNVELRSLSHQLKGGAGMLGEGDIESAAKLLLIKLTNEPSDQFEKVKLSALAIVDKWLFENRP